eukprot:1153223-Pelagomonas_calceolata.AAC.13
MAHTPATVIFCGCAAVSGAGGEQSLAPELRLLVFVHQGAWLCTTTRGETLASLLAHLACSDYEGVVQLWDVNANSEIMQFEEHSKRVWSVDYSSIDPTRLVSGSDDGTIKIWTLNQESSIASIDCKVGAALLASSARFPGVLSCQQ